MERKYPQNYPFSYRGLQSTAVKPNTFGGVNRELLLALNSGGSTEIISTRQHLERRLPFLLAFTPVYIARMRLIYTHPNLLIVGAMRNALDELGIETEIRNDIWAVPQVKSRPVTWIELWIVNDEQAPAAMRRIQRLSISLTRRSGTAIIVRQQQRLSSVGSAKRIKPKFGLA